MSRYIGLGQSDVGDIERSRSPSARSGTLRLLQARVLVLCGLPIGPTPLRMVTRRARIGRSSLLSVSFASTEEGVEIPYGSDRALLGWIQTCAYSTGFVGLDSLTSYFRAFELGQSGRDYRRFHERLRRIESLAISIRLESPSQSDRVHLHPLKHSVLPGREVSLLRPPDLGIRSSHRYGFQLDPDFWSYLRRNPVPLPLPLMRRFHNRPLAWDLAAFVLYRSFVASAPVIVPWHDLGEQLASVDRNGRRLRAHLRDVLGEVERELNRPCGRFLPGDSGLLVEPWRKGVFR